MSGFGVAFLQEFGPQIRPASIKIGHPSPSYMVHVAPGISKHSRSNAIVLTMELDRFRIAHLHCPMGNLVGLKMGKQFIVLLNMHLPHRKHHITLDQAWDSIDSMINRFLEILRCKFSFCNGAAGDNIAWYWGGDMNQNLSEPYSRSLEIITHLAKYGLKHLDYEDVMVTSHTQRGDGSESAIDWLGTDVLHSDMLYHPWSSNSIRVLEVLQGLTDTDHKPVFCAFSMKSMFHYQDIRENKKSRFREGNHRVRKGWNLPDAEHQAWQHELDDKILACGKHITIDQYNDCLVTHAAGHVCNRTRRVNKYNDPPDIRELCEARRQCGSNCILAKRELSKQINKHRRAAKAEHKETLCQQLAHRRWDSKRELDGILESEAKTNPQSIIAENGEVFGVERAHEWGDVVCAGLA